MLLSVVPSYDTMAAKPDNPGISENISIKQLTEPKTVKMADGRVMEKIVHIFHHDKSAKPDNGKGGGPPDGKNKGGSTCYSVISKGAVWKTAENYIVDESGSGLVSGYALTGIQNSVSSWESEITSGQDVFLSGSAGQADIQKIGQETNEVNEVLFNSLSEPGVIAVTISWGYFSGPPPARELVEWDMVFNTSYTWGDVGPTNETERVDTETMDYLNIATHEVGHAAGLDHSGDTCANESMYAYANSGETKKRTLEAGDIAGINSIY